MKPSLSFIPTRVLVVVACGGCMSPQSTKRELQIVMRVTEDKPVRSHARCSKAPILGNCSLVQSAVPHLLGFDDDPVEIEDDRFDQLTGCADLIASVLILLRFFIVSTPSRPKRSCKRRYSVKSLS